MERRKGLGSKVFSEMIMIPAGSESHGKVIRRELEHVNGVSGVEVFHNINVCQDDRKFFVTAYHEYPREIH